MDLADQMVQQVEQGYRARKEVKEVTAPWDNGASLGPVEKLELPGRVVLVVREDQVDHLVIRAIADQLGYWDQMVNRDLQVHWATLEIPEERAALVRMEALE
jgi:hypothetical protein